MHYTHPCLIALAVAQPCKVIAENQYALNTLPPSRNATPEACGLAGLVCVMIRSAL